jgi:plasmid stability protein
MTDLLVECIDISCELCLGFNSHVRRLESPVERAMISVTVRMPADLMDRVRVVAARDYDGDSAALRRLLRLGLEADERREMVDRPAVRETVEGAA